MPDETREARDEEKRFDEYETGDYCRGVKIKEVLYADEDKFIVFLDERNASYYDWRSAYDAKVTIEARRILRQTDIMQTYSVNILDAYSSEQGAAFRELIGYAIVAALDGDPTSAQKILDNARDYYVARAKETSAIWKLQSAGLVAAMILVLYVVTKFIASYFVVKGASLPPEFDQRGVAIVMGAVGALMSVLMRFDSLAGDPRAGRVVHYTSTIVRMLVGAAAGFVVYEAQRSNVLGDVFSWDKGPLMLICLVAGWSERLLPNLMQSVEDSVVGHKANPANGEGAPPGGNGTTNAAGEGEEEGEEEEHVEEESDESDENGDAEATDEAAADATTTLTVSGGGVTAGGSNASSGETANSGTAAAGGSAAGGSAGSTTAGSTTVGDTAAGTTAGGATTSGETGQAGQAGTTGNTTEGTGTIGGGAPPPPGPGGT